MSVKILKKCQSKSLNRKELSGEIIKFINKAGKMVRIEKILKITVRRKKRDKKINRIQKMLEKINNH